LSISAAAAPRPSLRLTQLRPLPRIAAACPPALTRRYYEQTLKETGDCLKINQKPALL